jgi:four helix bundle protein
LRAIKRYQFLQEGKDGAGWILGKQYLRAATSIGANIEEAQSGQSRADFIHKLSIAQKEARESLYWLRLLAESKLVPPNRITSLMQETEELIAVITTIIVKAKKTKNLAV